MRTWGVSVPAYFVVSESERYGSTRRNRPPRLSRNPLCPSHQRASPAPATSARNASSANMGSINWPRSQLVAREPHARDEVRELLPRCPARGLREAAVGREDEALRRREAERLSHARRDLLGRLDPVALHVDDADGGVGALRDLPDDLELGELAARHLDVDLV